MALFPDSSVRPFLADQTASIRALTCSSSLIRIEVWRYLRTYSWISSCPAEATTSDDAPGSEDSRRHEHVKSTHATEANRMIMRGGAMPYPSRGSDPSALGMILFNWQWESSAFLDCFASNETGILWPGLRKNNSWVKTSRNGAGWIVGSF